MMTSQEFTVRGMTCPSCAQRVRRTLNALTGVRGMDVQQRQGRVVVDFDPQLTDADALAAAITAAGYPADAVSGQAAGLNGKNGQEG